MEQREGMGAVAEHSDDIALIRLESVSRRRKTREGNHEHRRIVSLDRTDKLDLREFATARKVHQVRTGRSERLARGRSRSLDGRPHHTSLYPPVHAAESAGRAPADRAFGDARNSQHG